MIKISQIEKQLELAQKYLNEEEFELCHLICSELYGVFDKIKNNTNVLVLKDKHIEIIRNLNLQMAKNIRITIANEHNKTQIVKTKKQPL